MEGKKYSGNKMYWLFLSCLVGPIKSEFTFLWVYSTAELTTIFYLPEYFSLHVFYFIKVRKIIHKDQIIEPFPVEFSCQATSDKLQHQLLLT